MILAQAVPQISKALVVAEDSEPLVPFLFFLGMVPWGHHIEILQNCKDIREAVFYVEKTIQNNWSRAMLSHAIAADFYKDAGKPLHNFALTLPKPQGDLAADLMKSELNLGFLCLKEGYDEADLEHALVHNLRRFLLEMGPDFLLKGEQIEFSVGDESGKIDLLLTYTDNLMRMVEEHLDALQVVTEKEYNGF